MVKPRVAVIGVGSIGKFHAREYHEAGCNVVAILERSLETAKKKAKELKKEFGIDAKPYDDLENLLLSENLDMISVCTPAEFHYYQTRKCLESNVNVMCEKPFAQNYETARELFELARRQKKVLTVNTQWASVIPKLRESIDLSEISRFTFYMEPPIPGITNLISETLPHVNSMLLALTDGEYQNVENIQLSKISEEEVKIDFDYGNCRATCHLKRKEERPRNFYFSVNETRFDRNAFMDGEVFRQQLTYGDEAIDIEDGLKISIRKFIGAVADPNKPPLISEKEAVHNVKMQEEIMGSVSSLLHDSS